MSAVGESGALRSSVLQYANWPLQNVWHTHLTDPRQVGILQTRSWLTGARCIWSIETARVHHDEQYAARLDRQDPAPPALRSPYGKPRARDADARFGGALELGGTDFGRRVVRPRSGRHRLQDGERGGAGGAGMGRCHGAAAGGRRPRAAGL